MYDHLPLIRGDYVHFLAISKPIRFSPNIIDEELLGTVNKLFSCQQVHFYIHINRKDNVYIFSKKIIYFVSFIPSYNSENDNTIWEKNKLFLYFSTFVKHYTKTILPLQTLVYK